MENDKEQILITGVPDGANIKIIPDGRLFGEYDMTIATDKDCVVGCSICGEVINDDCYYCEDDNIFMHKACLIEKHRIVKNITLMSVIKEERSEHEDKRVNVRFKEVEK